LISQDAVGVHVFTSLIIMGHTLIAAFARGPIFVDESILQTQMMYVYAHIFVAEMADLQILIFVFWYFKAWTTVQVVHNIGYSVYRYCGRLIGIGPLYAQLSVSVVGRASPYHTTFAVIVLFNVSSSV
jgi:hypothetical protein